MAPYVSFGEIDVDSLVKEESEVSEILIIKLEDLLSEECVAKQKIKMGNGVVLSNVPVFNINSKVIWGATAMMLHEFKDIVKEIV